MWRSASRLEVLLSLAWLTVLPAMAEGASRSLTFEDRVEYQRRIEEVYWQHRIWPQENPGAKPALAAVLPEARLRARVEDYLKKSNALEALWKRPITAAQLQAEMERMAQQSRAPEGLREIFAALDDDPFVIAETLARQTLAERLIRNWYAQDERFHGDLRLKAEAALQGASSAVELSTLGAEYTVRTLRLKAENDPEPEPRRSELALDAREWREHLERLAGLLGTGPGLRTETELLAALPLMTVSALQDGDGAFFVTSVVKKGAASITEATASWPKVAFDAWWVKQGPATSAELAPGDGQLTSVEVSESGACEPGTWQSVASGSPPFPMAGHTAVWTGSEMIITGGSEPGGRYSPSTDTWVPTPPVGGLHRRAVWTGSEMIVWGGHQCEAYPGDECWSLGNGFRYDPSSDSWVGTAAVGAPTARHSHTAVWTGGEMIVWGGVSCDYYSGDCDIFNTGGRYDPSSDSWVATTSTGAPSARGGHTAVWTGSEMIVWGNSDDSTGGRYAPTTDTWTATSTGTNVPSPRGGHTAVWTGSEMIVWGGGYGGAYLNTGRRYDPTGDTWIGMTTTGAPGGRSSHTTVWTGSEMIVWGGLNDGSYLDTGGRYDPTGDTWIGMTTTGAPGGRSSHTTVWTGSEMIVWGGRFSPVIEGDSYFDTGGRYDPTTDSWVATSLGAPRARSGHTAVWTGSEMIVWGGIGQVPLWDSIFLSTGGSYDPSTNSWKLTPTTGAPEKRAYHTAVWTGSEMIVWGGGTENHPPDGTPTSTLGSGGRYNPITDTWTATKFAGEPLGRWYHTAVWTGSEMIVWGGQLQYSDGTQIDQNTGGRYDPFSDSWVSTTTTGAPSARLGHTVIWTGGEMIVWGGRLGGFYPPYFDTGGRYDPSTDSWVATTTTGAPSARYGHAAVWTGSEMIVWGGRSTSGSGWQYFNTGGRYDPSTDSWVATTAPGNLSARFDHTAVWTGDWMIIWGGKTAISSPPSATGTGKFYDPATGLWADTTDSDAPAGRSGHTAVWTGSEMFVWGGQMLNSGGRYCPCDFESNDGDLVSDCADNCPLAANGLQEDSDNDSVGDVCDSCTDTDGDGSGDPGFPANTCALDNCPGLPTESQADTDHDSHGDLCDNCYLAVNAAQKDTDTDGVGDACDCMPDDPLLGVILGPAHDLRFLSKTELAWDKPLGDYSPWLIYDLLRAGGPSDWLAATCLETHITVTSASDTEIPADVFFYLVRVQSQCGENLGSTSDDVRRVGVACEPE